jgi:hypothetical protein
MALNNNFDKVSQSSNSKSLGNRVFIFDYQNENIATPQIKNFSNNLIVTLKRLGIID